MEATGDAVELALQRYRSSVRGKLLGEALVESSSLVAAALAEMSQSHARTVSEMNAQVAGLQEQLFEAVAVIESLGGQTADDTHAFSPPSVAQRSFALEVDTSSHEKGDDSTRRPTETEETRLTDEQEQQQRLSSLGGATSEAFRTAQSGSRCTGGTALPESDPAHSPLSAELLQTRGTLKLQQQQQASMGAQLKELTALLSRVVKENATYRQEVQLLRATTVSVEEHRRLLQERDALEQECQTMKVELQRLKAEMETALGAGSLLPQQQQGTSLLDLGHIHEGVHALLQNPSVSAVSAEVAAEDVTHSSSWRQQTFHSAHSQSAEVMHPAPTWNGEELQHEGLWKTAIRELEQQAVIAASQFSAAERLREAESRIEELESLEAELRTALEMLEAEDKCVREDCEQLVFRNAVLTQQVASLLVRVERQRRVLERQELQKPLLEEGESVSDSEVLLADEEPLRPNSRRTQRGRVASAVQSLLERRGAVSAHAAPSVGVAAEAVGAQEGISSFLDVTLQPAEPLEVEGGVRTGMSVFARSSHRSRRLLALRNLGSPSVEADVTRTPQLPLTDCLTGVALGRPSHYAVIAPEPLAAANRSGGGGSHRPSHSSAHSGNSADSATRTLCVSEGTEEDGQFLELLREDENLDRYSVNSVAQLLQRNQELLQQLYAATQRAEDLERRLCKHDDEENAAEDGGSHATSDVEAAQPHRRVNRKRRREETPSEELPSHQQQQQRKEEGGGWDSLQRRAFRHHCEEEENKEVREEEEEGDDAGRFLLASDDRYLRLKAHMEEHMSAVLQKHKAQLTLTDNGLAAALLRILGLERRSGEGGSGSSGHCRHSGSPEAASAVASATGTVNDAVVTSLVRLCTELGVRAANQTVDLVSAQQSEHAEMMQKCWEEAQRVLLRSAVDLQAAIAGLPHAAPSAGAQKSEDAAAAGVGSRSEHDQAHLLQNITSLLRTASLKEHTIQRVLQLAARRRRMVQRVCAEPLQEAGDGDEHDGDDDDDDDITDGRQALRQLQVKLEGAQTQYEKLLTAHHEERKQHTTLLDRMWRMEEEKADAVRSRDEALERMATMMTREEYEATVDALDAAKATTEDLEAQLRYAQETNNQQLQELNHWRQVGVEHERQREADAAIVARQLSDKDRLIAQLVQQNHQIEARNAEQQASIRQMEAYATQQRDKLTAQYEDERALREQLRRVERALLEQQCTQDLLFAIFPGDRALAENRNLIQAMHAEKERLAETVASLQLSLDKAHRDLDSAQLRIHAAEQARQDAELHLHEASLCRPNIAPATVARAETDVETVELELLQRINATLLAEKRDWMEREALLREQLAVLGRDPVSENARRYGLKATRSFEEQLVELQERCLALQARVEEAKGVQETVTRLTSDVESLTTQLDATKSALTTQQASNEALQKELDTMVLAMQQKEESHDAVRLTLTEKEELISSITGAVSMLEKEVEKMDERLRAGDEERQRLYQDNVKLIENVAALMEDVKKKEAERKAAQAALAQGLASASAAAASHRWRGRSAGGGSSTGPMSITGSLGRTPT
ncbi:hypothetical protein TraAM80_02953 [Trypanosoma rangeli]|uniref:Uncharacterized protein n=1 Tax=Trypanosoma rangeli TaxID=5698 RepID=A0A422NRF4_TRYRA|nr:uncharacterized protein TraAM80_02953 [Trypanosoma rangeli]RNF08021.1 hypothetical protein TraAM80_02953 [Trypanosoma rangeli]|eukprot:RNF08021.1 hypothetical protein TraAM80_02953 [Trypanosoma rangeli]